MKQQEIYEVEQGIRPPESVKRIHLLARMSSQDSLA